MAIAKTYARKRKQNEAWKKNSFLANLLLHSSSVRNHSGNGCCSLLITQQKVSQFLQSAISRIQAAIIFIYVL